MKPGLKRTLGIIIIAVSFMLLMIAIRQTAPYLYVDFPCFFDDSHLRKIETDTVIAYCISIYPLEAISGGGIYDYGASNQAEFSTSGFDLRREEQTLFVNKQEIEIGEAFNTTKRTLSINPWIIFTRRTSIKNEGLLDDVEPSVPPNIMLVSGEIHEGWIVNPLGLILLGSGIWLLWQGIREFRQASTQKAKLN